jgi:hypothetical protein
VTDWHSEETYKGLIQLSAGALRFGALVNGGAVVALLALIGNLIGSGADVPDLKWPLTCFIIGITVAGLAQVTAYFTQLALYEESALSKPESGLYQHRTFLYMSLALVLLSIGLFCFGAFLATTTLTSGACAT